MYNKESSYAIQAYIYQGKSLVGISGFEPKPAGYILLDISPEMMWTNSSEQKQNYLLV